MEVVTVTTQCAFFSRDRAGRTDKEGRWYGNKGRRSVKRALAASIVSQSSERASERRRRPTSHHLTRTRLVLLWWWLLLLITGPAAVVAGWSGVRALHHDDRDAPRRACPAALLLWHRTNFKHRSACYYHQPNRRDRCITTALTRTVWYPTFISQLLQSRQHFPPEIALWSRIND